jgi:choline dehydrogenase-like flavoprotein
LPRCFKLIEDHPRGADGVRGTGGPLKISVDARRTPLSEALMAAAASIGMRRLDDINRADHEGIAYLSYTIRNGRRQSSAASFLGGDGRKRSNLRIITGAQATRALFEGIEATGVEYMRPDGSTERLHATTEVILCAGALESPSFCSCQASATPSTCAAWASPWSRTRRDDLGQHQRAGDGHGVQRRRPDLKGPQDRKASVTVRDVRAAQPIDH